MSFHPFTLHHPGAGATALLSVLLLAGCGASSTTAPSTSSSSAAGGASTPSSGAATPTPAVTVLTACPSSAEIATLTGVSFPAPQQSSASGTLTCNYNDTTSGASLVLVVASAMGTTAGDLEIAASAAASAYTVTDTAVSGFGSAAYAFTANDASTNASGVATSVIEILDGSDLIDITAELPLAEVKAVASYVLTQ